MKYIYGPVKSRRLGWSLGISLTHYKVCSFDCIYCQLGKTTQRYSQRTECVPISEVIEEFKFWLVNNKDDAAKLQFVTLSGSGEPTLNLRIAELISELRKILTVPIAVITNSSLLPDPLVRQALMGADLIVPSLDAVTQEVFDKIDRPLAGIKIEEIIEGLVSLRQEFKGKIWLEVMLVKGVNDDLRHIRKLKEALDRINPDIVQLNSPVRVTAEADVVPVDKPKLEKIREILGDKAVIV